MTLEMCDRFEGKSHTVFFWIFLIYTDKVLKSNRKKYIILARKFKILLSELQKSTQLISGEFIMSKIIIQNLEVQELISEVDANELSQIQGGNLLTIAQEIADLLGSIANVIK